MNPRLVFRSAIPHVRWPAVPDPMAGRLAAVLWQLELSQWNSAGEIARQQFGQLARLLEHAWQSAPAWRERLAPAWSPGTELDAETWRRLPLLRRRDIQLHGHALRSGAVPREHGRVVENSSSGSTGSPVTVATTELAFLFWNAFNCREHLWQARDLGGKLAAIRAEGTRRIPRGGVSMPDWGLPASLLFETGPAALLDIATDMADQVQWLLRERPRYLLSHPTNIRALARHCLDHGIALPGLEEVRSFGETLDPEVRTLCRAAWNTPVTDNYSSQEVGTMALQCPGHEHLHVMSENLLLEVLDDDGEPCGPGAVGRVVVTPLHNLAMPLIRYEIGDYARVGAPCPCGRGLPVLEAIMGRSRNLLTLPDGRRHWPRFPAKLWAEIAPVLQAQLVQLDLQRVEARLVTARPLTADEEQRCRDVMRERLSYPFEVSISYLEAIPRTPNAKYEDFVSLVPER